MEAWLARAFVARRDGRVDDALAAFRRVLEIDPVNTDTLTNLAQALSLLGEFTQADSLLERARRLGSDTRGDNIYLELNHADPEAAWAAVDGRHPLSWGLRGLFSAALVSRDPQRIALALSPSCAPPRRRLQALDHPFPGGWNANAPYWPSALPGLLGDLDGVRAAEQDYLENSPRDVWAGLDIRLDLAIAFAPAGDPQRALEHLGAVAAIAGPASYLRFSIQPGLDSLHEQPRRYRDMYPSAFRPTAPSICC